MPQAPLQQSRSRRSSGASSRGGGGGPQTDAWRPPPSAEEAQYDFCNAFWSVAGAKRETYDGQEGFEALSKRMKVGTKTLEDLRAIFKERAAMEEDFAKKLSRLGRSPVGGGEVGHLDRAISQIKAEIDLSGQAHADLAALMKKQDAQIATFLTNRESTRKPQQQAVEKAFKVKREQRDLVSKAKAKYEQDAIQITGMNAHAALSQGRDLDKVTMKMDKISQTVVVNERDYKKYVDVLRETTMSWNNQWKAYCDLCQDQEEDRLGFIKARLWDWANALSTVAMTEDESSERCRVALEQSNPVVDLQLFVRTARTGHQIPDPPAFVDFKVNATPPEQTYKVARFTRSSAQGSAIKHSPSTVEDITRVFKTPPPGHEGQHQKERSRSTSPEKRQSSGVALGASASANALGSRPAFAPVTPSGSHSSMVAAASGKPPSNALANLENALQAFDQPSSSRTPLETSTSSSSMFSPSRQNAASRVRQGSEPLSSSQQAPTKQGQIAASMFKRRDTSQPMLSEEPGPSQAPARYEPPVNGSEAALGDPHSAKTLDEDEEDDPLIRAINQLSREGASSQPTRNSRSFAGPAPGAVALPGMSSGPPRQDPRGDPRVDSRQNSRAAPPGHQQRQSQQDLNSQGRRPPSRSTSPAPTASLMQAPPASEVPQAVGQYGQAFPGERSHPRPASRQGSNSSRISQPPRTASPQPFAGVGARGSSPGPQPFKAMSPAFVGQHQQQHDQRQQPPQRSSSPQPPRGHSPGPWQAHGLPQGSQTQQAYAQHQQQQSYQPQLAPMRPVSPLAFAVPSSTPLVHYGQPSPAQGYGQPTYSQQSLSSQYQSPAPYQHQPPPGQSQQGSFPPPSAMAGYGPSGYGTPMQARAPSPAPVAPGRVAPPPTGQFDDAGRPILFYVNAIYDYQAAGAEEFSFSKGDVIAVTATDPDGWWQGQPVGVQSDGHIFPSNFTELLS